MTVINFTDNELDALVEAVHYLPDGEWPREIYFGFNSAIEKIGQAQEAVATRVHAPPEGTSPSGATRWRCPFSDGVYVLDVKGSDGWSLTGFEVHRGPPRGFAGRGNRRDRCWVTTCCHRRVSDPEGQFPTLKAAKAHVEALHRLQAR